MVTYAYYETPITRVDQNYVRDRVDKLFDWTWRDNPVDPRINTLFLCEGVPILFADIRVRHNSISLYPDIMISEKDCWNPAMELPDKCRETEYEGVKVAFIHAFTEGIFFLPALKVLNHVRRARGKRTGRPEPPEVCRWPDPSLFMRIEDLSLFDWE